MERSWEAVQSYSEEANQEDLEDLESNALG